jgi:hypothetical protein
VVRLGRSRDHAELANATETVAFTLRCGKGTIMMLLVLGLLLIERDGCGQVAFEMKRLRTDGLSG